MMKNMSLGRIQFQFFETLRLPDFQTTIQKKTAGAPAPTAPTSLAPLGINEKYYIIIVIKN